MIKIGSHVSMKAPLYLEGAVQEALSYNANALMIYTGPPQNTMRKAVSLMHVEEAKELMKQNNIPIENVIVHAPYIINLANRANERVYDLAISFLRQEIDRVEAIGATYLVLHPGSSVQATTEEGIEYIAAGLNEVLRPEDKVIICLETMAGKGSEVGFRFEQLKEIRDRVILKEKIAVCLDTCHIHDAGYSVSKLDEVLKEFDDILGLKLLKVIHVNDSKNVSGARKDRHANLGCGEIGFEALLQVVHHPLLKDQVKILETPYFEDEPPYAKEIEMLQTKKFEPCFKTE